MSIYITQPGLSRDQLHATLSTPPLSSEEFFCSQDVEGMVASVKGGEMVAPPGSRFNLFLWAPWRGKDGRR